MSYNYAIYYAKNPTFTVNPHLTVANLTETHVKLREIEANDLDHAYFLQQGENWSPGGEARPLIEKLGLYHTSMSVGDVIVELNETGGEVRYHQVAAFGFEPFRVQKKVVVEICFMAPDNNEEETITNLEVMIDGHEVEADDGPAMLGGARNFLIWHNNACGIGMTYGEF